MYILSKNACQSSKCQGTKSRNFGTAQVRYKMRRHTTCFLKVKARYSLPSLLLKAKSKFVCQDTKA